MGSKFFSFVCKFSDLTLEKLQFNLQGWSWQATAAIRAWLGGLFQGFFKLVDLSRQLACCWLVLVVFHLEERDYWFELLFLELELLDLTLVFFLKRPGLIVSKWFSLILFPWQLIILSFQSWTISLLWWYSLLTFLLGLPSCVIFLWLFYLRDNFLIFFILDFLSFCLQLIYSKFI